MQYSQEFIDSFWHESLADIILEDKLPIIIKV